MSDTTPNDELRALIELWRDIADESPGDTTHDRGLRTCADSLELLINNE
jgi:hypothetical protein